MDVKKYEGSDIHRDMKVNYSMQDFLKDISKNPMSDKIRSNTDGTTSAFWQDGIRWEVTGTKNFELAEQEELELRSRGFDVKPIWKPLEPSENAPRSAWFAYYDECKKNGEEIDLSYIAKKIGVSDDWCRKLHVKYKEKLSTN